jgi:hypothetical protein
MMPAMRLLLRWSPVLLLGVAVADWALVRSGKLAQPQWALGALAAAVVAACAANALRLLWAARERARRWRGVAGAVALSGLAVSMGGGLANWLWFVQGFVILQELETVPLQHTAHLQQFAAGPLARAQDMHCTLQLEKVDLRPSLAGWTARSRLRIKDESGAVQLAEVEPGRAFAAGPLLFHQGAFGFAPRVVVVRGTELVLDRVVPFTVLRDGEDGAVRYEGDVEVPGADAPRLHAWVDLASLDSEGRGHARLGFEAVRDGRVAGSGVVQPGYYASFGEGGAWRVGFAGLEKWSEIDVSRRSYDAVLIGGALVAAAGALGFALAAWRRW